MLRKVLYAKIQGLRVTGKNLEYSGSITLPKDVIEEAGIIPGEAVLVVNMNNGVRFETYVIEGEKGKVELNGGAARLGEIGDKLIVMAFTYIDAISEEVKHTIIIVDDSNKIIEIRRKN